MRILHHILRLVLIITGFAVSVLCASAFLLFLVWGGIGQGDPDFQNTAAVLAGLGVPVLASFVSYYAFVPAVIVFIFAEISGRRSWLFHAISGILIALAALARRAGANGFDNPPSGIVMAVIAAGAVGGTAYWLVAGRSAGRHLDQSAATSAQKEP